MNLEIYNPRYNRTLVYVPSNNNFIDQINGLVSVCTLAILNDYSFVIKGLNQNYLSEIFQSNLDLWNTSWKDIPSKKGLWNLTNLTEVDLFDLKHIHLEKKFSYSEVIYMSTNINLVPYLLEGEIYKERLQYLEITKDDNVFLDILKNLFTEFEGDFQSNYEMLLDDFTSYQKRIVARIISMNEAETLVDEIKDEEIDKFLLSTNDFKIRDFLKSTLKTSVLTIPDIESGEFPTRLLQNLKSSYELFLFLSTEKKYLSESDVFSEVVRNTSN